MTKRKRQLQPNRPETAGRDEIVMASEDEMPEPEYTVSDASPEQPQQATRGPREAKRERRGRKARTPMGGSQPRLKADVPDGMQARWFNDVPGRIQEALDHDYAFINDAGAETDDRAGARSEIVGTKTDGSPLHAYLMAIPKEWHEEDQARKQAVVDEREQDIKHGAIHRVAPEDRENYYVPSEGIRVYSEN